MILHWTSLFLFLGTTGSPNRKPQLAGVVRHGAGGDPGENERFPKY